MPLDNSLLGAEGMREYKPKTVNMKWRAETRRGVMTPTDEDEYKQKGRKPGQKERVQLIDNSEGPLYRWKTEMIRDYCF